MSRSVRSVKSWLAAKSVIRMQSDDLTAKEQLAFEENVDQNEQFRDDFIAINQGLARVEGLADDPDILAIMDEVEEVAVSKPGHWRGFSMAAGLVFAVGVTLLLTLDNFTVDETGKNIKRYVTRIGEQKNVELSDGTLITMNTATELLVDINDEKRRIMLQRGEAYFDVAKDPARPFSVAVDEQLITALGTEFNVLKGPGQFTLAVLEGVVVVHEGDEPVLKNSPLLSDKGSEKTEVYISDQHRVTAGWVAKVDGHHGSLVGHKPKNMAALLQWRTGMLSFNGVPLSDVVKEMNRYSAKKILIEDVDIMNMNIYGSVRVDSLSSALKVLEKSYPLKVIYHFDSTVIVGQKK